MTITEMKSYIINNNLQSSVRELVSAGFTSTEAIEYVFDAHTLDKKSFAAKYLFRNLHLEVPIMTHELISSNRKTGGNFTFLRSILLVGDNKEYKVIEDVTYEGNKEFFVNYTVTANDQNSYLPEINYNGDKNCFTICCYSHGNMTPDEFEKFIKAQQQGLAVANFLTQMLCINNTKEDDSHETR